MSTYLGINYLYVSRAKKIYLLGHLRSRVINVKLRSYSAIGGRKITETTLPNSTHNHKT